jgi:hypothetical protein
VGVQDAAAATTAAARTTQLESQEVVSLRAQLERTMAETAIQADARAQAEARVAALESGLAQGEAAAAAALRLTRQRTAAAAEAAAAMDERRAEWDIERSALTTEVRLADLWPSHSNAHRASHDS